MNQADFPEPVPANALDFEDVHGVEVLAELIRQFWLRIGPPIYNVKVASGTVPETLNWD